ncbi:hypothetical protein BJ322DRAFT_1112110 [Thelephora terrestris]|uniref:Uncharacterized protein n=1 Tax=Thelephora terrestris TaxID=56493 RepID=A0A9P6H8R2_9AGAM|nr:hypothetical protein BJ322DRAFT_1112110 [Thelephora terrestris]
MSQNHSLKWSSTIPRCIFPQPTQHAQNVPQNPSEGVQHAVDVFQSRVVQWVREGHPNTPEEMSGDESGDKSGDSRDDEEPEDDESDTDEDDDGSDAAVLEWGRDPRRLRELEELRGDFESELKDPSAWTLQQISTLTEGDRLFKAREVVRLWLLHVAELTQSSVGGLQLPRMRFPEVLPEDLPNRRFLSWEEADESFDEACLEERYKRDARLTIQFLFPESETKGLSVGDKRRIYIIASKVWGMHKSKAMGLLWVMDKEYPDTRTVVGREREWPNLMSEDFMTYAALYPPPIVVCPRH